MHVLIQKGGEGAQGLAFPASCQAMLMPWVHGPHWAPGLGHPQGPTCPWRLTVARERSGGPSQSRIIQDTSFGSISFCDEVRARKVSPPI